MADSDTQGKKKEEETVLYKNSQGGYSHAPAQSGGWFSDTLESLKNGYDKASIDAARKAAAKVRK